MLMGKDEEFDLSFQDAESGRAVTVKARGRSTVHDILCDYARAVDSAGASEHFFFYEGRQLLPNDKTFLKDLQIDPQDAIIGSCRFNHVTLTSPLSCLIFPSHKQATSRMGRKRRR